MPRRGRFIALHEIERARIQCWQESPCLKGEDRSDEYQQRETAPCAHDAKPENDEPREGSANPFHAVERMEYQAANTQSLGLAYAGRGKFDGRFQKADGTDEAEPEQGDDEGVECEAAHDGKYSMLQPQTSKKI